MRTRAAEVQPRGRHAVAGVSKHRARGKKLVQCQRAVEDVAIRQAEDSLKIEWRETLPGDHARFEAWRIRLHRIDHQVGDRFAVLLPRRAVGKLRRNVLAESARDMRAWWG